MPMVHISHIELHNFKSFGGTTKIPFLPGFTVISGPNGSGKSNILDALLFCLGLASSRGMRAERLPDLVNHSQSQGRKTTEASVSVTFDLSDLHSEIAQVWRVTRRLRVTHSGSYASSYYINDQPCNLSELHQQLNRLRIYPEGYNVVLQGDVTRIITMNSRERREIIDELAGVAEFDRKITQAKSTLDEVKEAEERSQIVAQELGKIRDRLASDKLKAEKYQQLKLNLQEKRLWEVVISWRVLGQQKQKLAAEIEAIEAEIAMGESDLTTLEKSASKTASELDELNRQVKLLGEEEQLSLTSELAQIKVQWEQQQQQLQYYSFRIQQEVEAMGNYQTEISHHENSISQLKGQKQALETQTLPQLRATQKQIQEEINTSQAKVDELALHSQQLIQRQSEFNQQVNTIQTNLNNHNKIAARDSERCQQLEINIEQNRHNLSQTQTQLLSKQTEIDHLSSQLQLSQTYLQELARDISEAETTLKLAQETATRLLQEERDKQRQLDKLEAQQEAQQQAQGSYATNFILQAKLPGVHGLVVELGKVAPEYQMALEIAAGARLGYVVVDSDAVAATAINLLKENRVGRATFLPLNKIKSPQLLNTNPLINVPGYIDLAVNLIDCDHRYRSIFAYVFGNTLLFEDLQTARLLLGRYRLVTLAGEILETTGAMTGGSKPKRSSFRFGIVSGQEEQEKLALQSRLQEIEMILRKNQIKITETSETIEKLHQNFSNLKQQHFSQDLRRQQLQQECEQLSQQQAKLQVQLAENQQEYQRKRENLTVTETEIKKLEIQLAAEQVKLENLEGSEVHQQWQEWQRIIRQQNQTLSVTEAEINQLTNQIKDINNQQQRLAEKIKEAENKIAESVVEQQQAREKIAELEVNLQETEAQIQAKEQAIAQLSAELMQVKEQRDQTEINLQQLKQKQQEKTWHLSKLRESYVAKQKEEEQLTINQQNQAANLPNPFPDIPLLTGTATEQLKLIQNEITNLQKRIESLEPVNMLALEEYQETQARLESLAEKLNTLEAERTELLLRIETFTTARLKAFTEAFDAVNQNFQEIFASLSEGDGYLQLDDSQDPFNGGLNLIAHPKGKPVQRLSSMSGGEKSLTALSFIFSLQRYRPSPFYAFDEVDMFLDGANVEKLAKMIQHQAQLAQFIVVSLRRPMIESSDRTIGVTQARGKYTQVLGLKL